MKHKQNKPACPDMRCIICGKPATVAGYCGKHQFVRDMQTVLDAMAVLHASHMNPVTARRVQEKLRGTTDEMHFADIVAALMRLWRGGFIHRERPFVWGKAGMWYPV